MGHLQSSGFVSSVGNGQCMRTLQHTGLYIVDAPRYASQAAEMITSEMQPSRQLSDTSVAAAVAYTER